MPASLWDSYCGSLCMQDTRTSLSTIKLGRPDSVHYSYEDRTMRTPFSILYTVKIYTHVSNILFRPHHIKYIEAL